MSRPLKCLDCPESEVYSSENELEAHIAAEHIKLLPYGCGMCKYGKFPTEYALVKHYAEVHEITSNITLNVCYSTNLPLRRKELEEKLKMCKEARDSPRNTTPELKRTTSKSSDETSCRTVKCLDCAEVYHSKEMLVAHIAQEHLQSLPYKCEICKHAMFPTEHVLACHHKEDHKRIGAINLIMTYSPEIILERRELAKKLAMCLASSSRRSIDRVLVDRTPTVPARMDSHASASHEPLRKSSRVSKKRIFTDFVAEPATPPTSPRKSDKTGDTAPGSSTTPGGPNGTESNGISDTSNTTIHPDLDLVRTEPPPSPPPAKKQRPVKREAQEGPSEQSAKRVPVKPTLKTPLCLIPAESAVKTEVPDPEAVTSETVAPLKSKNPSAGGQQAKIEEPDDLLEIKKEANAESPCKVKRPVPYTLKIEESEGDQEEQEEQMEQGEDDNGSEVGSEGSEGSEDPKESVKCALCPKILKNASKKYHACFVHGDLALFECGYCGCKFNGDKIYPVKRHLLVNHKESDGSVDLNNFKDHRKKLRTKIQRLTEKCFPK